MKLRALREAIEAAEALGCQVEVRSRAPGVHLPLAEARAVVARVMGVATLLGRP